SITSPEGTAQFTYDANGNLVRGLYSDKTDLAFTYDDAGRLTAASSLTLAYDAAGRIVNSNNLAITRDASGRITSIAYPPGKVTYSYNNRGLLAQIADWAGASTTFAYDAALNLTSIARANGVTTQYSYDGNGNLSGITETKSAAISTIALQRDAAGQIVGSDRNVPQPPSPAAGTQSATFDSAHQIAGATYDSLGRLTKDALRTYAYDLDSRMLSYQGADGSASFTYDGLGTRISRSSGGTTEKYTLNYALGVPAISVVNSGGADQRYYIHLPDGSILYSVEAAGTIRQYFHFDEAGNTLFLTSDSGSVTAAYGITPYGEGITQSAAVNNPFTWQGKFGVMQEVLGSLFYMRARFYDAAAARFVSRDPVESLAPNAIDPYQYALGNPVTNTDPTGLSAAQVNTSNFRPRDFFPRAPIYGFSPLGRLDPTVIDERNFDDTLKRDSFDQSAAINDMYAQFTPLANFGAIAHPPVFDSIATPAFDPSATHRIPRFLMPQSSLIPPESLHPVIFPTGQIYFSYGGFTGFEGTNALPVFRVPILKRETESSCAASTIPLEVVALIIPVRFDLDQIARRNQCINNLKQIGLGSHNYHQPQ
ncbi:MAG TPA: RHS repeat-associated core domain-containing protein, partial [Bryobacteraceae bacterium]|nr:RHS repeat-associated core domain-containing protein [Bryobacteraceae bacterium]